MASPPAWTDASYICCHQRLATCHNASRACGRWTPRYSKSCAMQLIGLLTQFHFSSLCLPPSLENAPSSIKSLTEPRTCERCIEYEYQFNSRRETMKRIKYALMCALCMLL